MELIYNSTSETLCSKEGSTPHVSISSITLKVDQHTSDGYHTFDELYFHRVMLFSVICKTFKKHAWKSKKHHDGTMFPNYFIIGLTTPEGDYTYHYDLKYWDLFDVQVLDRAPTFDGHQPDDIHRLFSLFEEEKR